MNFDNALDWLDGQKGALSAEADTALAARHEQFLVEAQAALDYVWAQLDTWSDTDVGYPVRLRMLMERLATASNGYAADVTALARSYGVRAWHFSYFGQAWLLAAQLPDADISIGGRQDVAAIVGGAIEGVDLPAAIENVRIEFLQRARKEMILSQSAKENYHKARARLLNVAGLTEEQVAQEQVQEAARRPITFKRAKIMAQERIRRTGALARAFAAVHATMVRAAAEAIESVAQDNAEFINGFIWRTMGEFATPPVCPRCAPRDGRWYEDTVVKPPLHVRCRCEWSIQARTLAELGMVDIPMPFIVRSYGEWALDAGVQYDGGLGVIRSRRAKWRVSKPKPGHPGVDRSASARARRSAREWARKNVRPVDTEPRWGQESAQTEDGMIESITVNSQSELDALLAEAAEKGWTVEESGNPYHEPAGSPIGGQFAHKQGMSAIGDDDFLASVRSGIIGAEELGGGVCKSFLIHFANGEDGAWKPISDDKGRHSGHSEVAAYQISKVLGLDVVPPTIYYKYNGMDGTVQRFIKGARSGGQGGKANEQDGRKVVLLDVVIGNADRHVGNFVVDSNGKTWGIDHGHVHWYKERTSLDESTMGGRSMRLVGDRVAPYSLGSLRKLHTIAVPDVYREKWQRLTQKQFMFALKNIKGSRVKKTNAWEALQLLMLRGEVSWDV